MNAIVRRAIDAVVNAHTVTTRLAAVVDPTKVDLDSAEFLSAVSAAQTAVEAAMDEVDGQALTALDHAVDALASARNAFAQPGENNRKAAAAHTADAKQHADSVSHIR